MSHLEKPLSDEELDYQEKLIPQLAVAATTAAYAKALALGHSIAVVDGEKIVLRQPNGTQTVIAERKPRQKVSTGKTITAKKLRPN